MNIVFTLQILECAHSERPRALASPLRFLPPRRFGRYSLLTVGVAPDQSLRTVAEELAKYLAHNEIKRIAFHYAETGLTVPELEGALKPILEREKSQMKTSISGSNEKVPKAARKDKSPSGRSGAQKLTAPPSGSNPASIPNNSL